MYTQPSTPRSIGGVLDDTIQLYKASFSSCVVLGVIIGLLSFGFSLYMQRSLGGPPLTPAQQLAAIQSPAVLLGYLILIPVSLLFYTAVTANVYAVSRGEHPTLGTGLTAALRAWLSMLVATIVFSLLLVCGFILLVLPGIYLWNRLQLWPVAVAGEGQGPMQGLGTSWRLVHGHWWRTFITFTVLVIIAVVVFTVFGMIAGFAAAAFGVNPASALIVTQLISSVATVFTIPAFPSAIVAIHHDLKLRKEGGDLEARVSNLQSA